MQSWVIRYGWIGEQDRIGHVCATSAWNGSIDAVTAVVEANLVSWYGCSPDSVVVQSSQYVNDRLLLRTFRGTGASGVEWFAEAELDEDSAHA